MTRVAVVGTATEIGKTHCAAELLGILRRAGRQVAARKPAQSYEPGTGPTDAEVLAAATGEDPENVCPPQHTYPVAMAPPMAAEALGLAPPTLAGLLGAMAPPPPGCDLLAVEGAGGVRSPIAADADNVDLVAALAPERVLLVADAGLGTINAVRLSVDALATVVPAASVLVLLNRYDARDDLHRRNAAWLTASGYQVRTDCGTLADDLTAVRDSSGDP